MSAIKAGLLPDRKISLLRHVVDNFQKPLGAGYYGGASGAFINVTYGETIMDEEGSKDRAAYSIPDWCGELGINVSFYHKIKKQGLGPREMHVATRAFVIETPREYCKRREAESAQPRMTEAL